MMTRLAFLLVALALVGAATAASLIPPASERFLSASGESPDFQKHVVPLLSRSGCNGRACHGSFQGQGGFQLSLFGYDFQADHRSVAQRVDPGTGGKSLLLRKPLERTDHEGGRRIEEGSWQHHLLLNWIQSGAKGALSGHKLRRLIVTPAEIVFAASGDHTQLRVVAEWADGVREDVTCLSRFRVNNDSIAKINSEGRVEAGEPGDTHVVAFYDNGVEAIPVLRPFAPSQLIMPARTPIDRLVQNKLAKLGIQPSEICTDAEFLRRISIDLTGTLPTPAEVAGFLGDKSANKRQRKIDELLDRPAYAAWWANKLCDFTGNNPSQQSDVGQEQAVQWYRWIYARLQRNVPYDELVANIVIAKSRDPGVSYGDYAGQMSAYFRVENRADFAERKTMPHYWSRRTLAKPEDKALAFAHSFLGLQLQCAQCHKHPFDQWSKSDFGEFTKFFETVRYGVAPDGMKQHQQLAKASNAQMRGGMMMRMGMDMLGLAEEGQVVPWREVYLTENSQRSLNLLGQRNVKLDPKTDPRQALMDWMREPENPFFARAFVNRVWANYFGIGIIDPPDDLNRANPPSNRALLRYLEDGFRASGFDMRWLHHEIVSSAAYQRSWRPNPTNEGDRRNFSRMLPRRLPAEVVYDALAQVTAADSAMVQVRTNLARRAIGHLSMRMAGTYAMNTFGKPARSTNCDCERNAKTSLLQTLFLKNDPILRNRLSESGWLNDLTAYKDEELIEQSYLRTLARYPTVDEGKRCQKHLSATSDRRAGMEDLLWALLNTKEFLMNH
jgi:hypothetical protein